jgi:hypothetical protein
MLKNNDLLKKITTIIESSREKVYTAFNTEITLMYWHIGEAIKIDILENQKAEYGKSVVEELSKSLTLKYDRGYGVRNLFNMLKFNEVFSEKEILHTVCAKLSWSHLRQIMYIEQRDTNE